MVVRVEELRVSIERHLDDLSDEAERLRAALQALGPTPGGSLTGDTSSATSSIGGASRSRGSRRRTDTRGATQHAAREAPADGLALTAREVTGLRRPTIAATPSDLLPGAGRTVEDCAAGAAGGEETAPTMGADRALQELRSELTAALRTTRS